MGIERLSDGDAPNADCERGTADVPDVGMPEATHEIPDQRAYTLAYRETVEAEIRAAARGSWNAEVPALREAWAEHEKRWPLPERSGHPPNPDDPGGWHGVGGRYLNHEANAEVDAGYEDIREVGDNVVTPAMRRIEAEDPDRYLLGLEYRLKGSDRIKEKVADDLRAAPGSTAAQALSKIPDAIRFTFCYSEERYAEGVRADLIRLRSQGFELAKPLKNFWESDQYKGINTQWREPETQQRFEVQFHTRASFEAKQLSHDAYERIRNPQISDTELDELEDFQRRVCAGIPVPPGTHEIYDHPRKEHDG